MNIRAKGATGELQAAKWLAKWLELGYIPDRNLEQVRSGGHDLRVEPFTIEVKRCEQLALDKWWKQVNAAIVERDCPVVMYRQNRKQWRFLIPATLIGVESGFLQVGRDVFLKWAKQFVKRGKI